jgi:hypothetical protein
MLKKQEIDNLASCLNQAAMDEPLFVLRGKDICAADTVREWTRARVRAGKNHPQDKQILEALAIADAMGAYSAKRAIEAKTKPAFNPAAAWPFPTGSRP